MCGGQIQRCHRLLVRAEEPKQRTKVRIVTPNIYFMVVFIRFDLRGR